jgi:formiminoglutamate deiminase
VPRFWCELAWLGGDTATADVLVDVDGDRITAVTAGVPCPPDAVRLAGLTLPGMANAHSHAFHRALRGRTHAGTGSFWTWRDQMYRVASRLTPDTYFQLARATYAEMALAGITAVGEFHYLHHGPGGVPYDDPNAMSAALVTAAAEAGVRIMLLDTCYLHGGIGVAPNEVQQRFSDGDTDGWRTRVDRFAGFDPASARLGAAVHSVRAVDPASMAVVAEWAAGRDAPLHAHVSEQVAENQQCIEAHGTTPTHLLADHGVLSDRFTAVHATHLTDDDIARLGAHRCSICMCPTTERDLADGIGPARRLRDAGASITLGSDSHAVIDLFEEARAVELDERLATQVRGQHTASQLLTAATVDGHRSIGWADAGAIVVGGLADLVSVRLDSVRTAGSTPHTALAAAVFAASAADVHHVVSGGRVVVRDGQHVSLDVAAELARTIAAVQEDR